MKAQVRTDSYPDKVYRGWIGFISPTAEFTPKTVETGDLRTRLVYQVRVFACNPENELPLGYKQRLAMAAALMHEPEILFLDEPTSGVDPLARREFWHRINLLAEQGVTVLVTTHFMDEANYCDRLLIMADGETLAQGTPAEMKARFRGPDLPDPTMEDAFIGLMERRSAVSGEQGR